MSDGRTARILAAIAELRAETAMEADLAAVRAAVMERIDRLQDTMDGPRDDIGVNFGNTDRVEASPRRRRRRRAGWRGSSGTCGARSRASRATWATSATGTGEGRR